MLNTYKFYFLYKTVNQINSHFYLGKHCTNDLDDKYLGSGKRLKAAIKKYGKENFKREILSFHSTYEDLCQTERDLITLDLLKSKDCYNLAQGGHGGYTYYDDRKYSLTSEQRKRISESKIGKPRPDLKINSLMTFWIGKKRSEVDRQNKSDSALANVKLGKNPFVKLVSCPHCNKQGQYPNMVRWHFENCKENKCVP